MKAISTDTGNNIPFFQWPYCGEFYDFGSKLCQDELKPAKNILSVHEMPLKYQKEWECDSTL